MFEIITFHNSTVFKCSILTSECSLVEHNRLLLKHLKVLPSQTFAIKIENKLAD